MSNATIPSGKDYCHQCQCRHLLFLSHTAHLMPIRLKGRSCYRHPKKHGNDALRTGTQSGLIHEPTCTISATNPTTARTPFPMGQDHLWLHYLARIEFQIATAGVRVKIAFEDHEVRHLRKTESRSVHICRQEVLQSIVS